MRAPPPLVALAVALTLTGAPAAEAGAPTNDPYVGVQWSLGTVKAPDAWTHATGDGITIAIVDSGADLGHEDLKGKIVGSADCIGSNGDPAACHGLGNDDDGHGTHVAGIAAAATDNGRGVAGVAPDASLLIVRALEHSCDVVGANCTASGTAADVSAAIEWAAQHGADVINLSLGSTRQAVLGPSFKAAIRFAWDNGAIPVVASGNDYVLSSGFATEPAVVVTATTRGDAEASYANGVGRAQWGLAAPGGDIGDTNQSCAADGAPRGVLSSFWEQHQHNGYACLAGTSMAAPHVAGGLALLRSAGLTPQQAVNKLLATAVDLGPSGRDSTFGYGRVDLAAATADLPLRTSTTNGGATTTTPRSSTTARARNGSTPTSMQRPAPNTPRSPSRSGDQVAVPTPFGEGDDHAGGAAGAKPVGVVASAVALVLGGWALGLAALRRGLARARSTP